MLWLQHRIVALVGAMVLLLGASVAQASQCVDHSADGRALDDEEVVLVPTSPVPATFDATVPVEVRRSADGCDGIDIDGDDVPICASEGASEVAPKPIEPTSDAEITGAPCEEASAFLASVTQNDDDRHDPPTASPAGHAVLPTLPAAPHALPRDDTGPRRARTGPHTRVGPRVERPPQG